MFLLPVFFAEKFLCILSAPSPLQRGPPEISEKLPLGLSSQQASLEKHNSQLLAILFFFLFCYNACGILVSQPEIEPTLPSVEVPSLNHWTIREVSCTFFPANTINSIKTENRGSECSSTKVTSRKEAELGFKPRQCQQLS